MNASIQSKQSPDPPETSEPGTLLVSFDMVSL